MSRQSRSMENRQRVLRVAAYVSPFSPFTVDAIKQAAEDEDVRSGALHDESDEIIVDEDALDRLVEAGELEQVGESEYELTSHARQYSVGGLIEREHDREGVEVDAQEMSTQEMRTESPSGLMYLFNDAEMRYVIDAILESPPSKTLTPERLAERAGVSVDAVETCLPKLVEVGVLRRVDAGYELWEDTTVTSLFMQLNGAINRMASIDSQAALANPDMFPERRYGHFCEECGALGEYAGSTPFGAVLACSDGHGEWVTHADTPAGRTLRLDMITDIDEDDVAKIREKNEDERTDREETILSMEERFEIVAEE